MSSTYKSAGVDIEAAEAMLANVKDAVRRTHTAGVLQTLSDFGGLYALTGYREPVLVSGTDGVGTKLKIAFALDKHDTIGQDLVAMCVDDIVVQGARPLFFLDYFATGKLRPETGAAVIKGIAAACEIAQCALIGGETAELPGFYGEGEYDLAGFAVGAVEKSEIIDGSAVAEGDVILGLGSSGLHSNGFSLARKVLLASAGLKLDEYVRELGQTVGEALLEPTRIYCADLVAMLDEGLRPHGMAHITGGGWPGNISRVVPDGLCAVCDQDAVLVPPICELIQRAGGVARAEMYRTFNMGIGMVVIVAAEELELFVQFLSGRGLPVMPMGHIEAGTCRFRTA
ncbi:MAG: phosphoribosylformylglycinamidine cyclo-ligase [Armatimonadetes bacterium]|nr:phosphoribosylformylglycinamidine cyclo-ligase [Armatimonadota bacterium]